MTSLDFATGTQNPLTGCALYAGERVQNFALFQGFQDTYQSSFRVGSDADHQVVL
jgi:hypothetical protein